MLWDELNLNRDLLEDHALFAVMFELQRWLRSNAHLFWGVGDDVSRLAERTCREIYDAIRGIELGTSFEVLRASVDEKIIDKPNHVAARSLAVALGIRLKTHSGALFGPLHQLITGEGPSSPRKLASLQLRPGDPIPIAHHASYRYQPEAERIAGEAEGWIARAYGTDGSMPYEQAPERVPAYTLAPPDFLGFDVHLDFSTSDALVQLESTTIYATAHPMVDHHEINISANHLTVVDPETVMRRRRDILEASASARLLVFPEACTTAELRDGTVAHWAELPRERRPPVLVPGSVYQPGEHGVTNSASVFVVDSLERVAPGLAHKKFEPVRRGNRVMNPLREPLTPEQPRIELHVLQRGVKLATLVCRDALNAEACRLLLDLEVDIIAIPASTPDTRPFLTKALDWATSQQASMVMSNFGPRGSGPNPSYSIIGRPGAPFGGWDADHYGSRRIQDPPGTVEGGDDASSVRAGDEVPVLPGVQLVNDDTSTWRAVRP